MSLTLSILLVVIVGQVFQFGNANGISTWQRQKLQNVSRVLVMNLHRTITTYRVPDAIFGCGQFNEDHPAMKNLNQTLARDYLEFESYNSSAELTDEVGKMIGRLEALLKVYSNKHLEPVLVAMDAVIQPYNQSIFLGIGLSQWLELRKENQRLLRIIVKELQKILRSKGAKYGKRKLPEPHAVHSIDGFLKTFHVLEFAVCNSVSKISDFMRGAHRSY